MSQKIITFGNIVVEKHKLHQLKNPLYTCIHSSI